uniref:NADH-ubiquinone oxidoreductase chain 2 n=1 Tax=Acanthaspis cincticrus TaxID=1911546 RepID=A0A220QK69_9HEMI|nr:NADH dehydrogenase subunit 2 [Acanthaspis cincticrus]ASK05194.1 NADH dehydrogenase subunit 2 [Acanthaspis cincticrus]AVZ00740.1 NADH dehydrogenase subunit 2 [Acanthaspis cincticrus]
MTNVSKMLFYSIMVLGTLLTLSSETWLGMWMGLEMNLIAFIPILYKSKNIMASESCMIYFLIQSLGSILMLVSVLSNSLITMSQFVIDYFFYSTLMFSMFIKLGVPPFHFWFPEILDKMSWIDCMILMTWQKIAPLSILSLVSDKSNMLPVIIILSTITGAIGGLNQTSLRKIMGYSSINHMGWMIACMKFSNELWMKYLVIYSIILMMMIYTFNTYSSYTINQFTSTMSSFMEKSLIIILFMSLGGLPPFLGFLPKWMVIQELIYSNSYTMLMIMIMSVLITLFYYLRLVSTTILISNSTYKWFPESSLNMNMQMLLIIANISLPVISTFSI